MRLTIYIPTVGRPEIADLLESIPPRHNVEVIVSDNSSLVGGICAQHPHVQYERREFNTGIDANLLRGTISGTGEWVWIIGDDDALLPGALDLVLDAVLEDAHPLTAGIDRLIVLTPESVDYVPLDSWGPYSTGGLIEALQADTSLLIAATLCTANIFRRHILDPVRGLEEFDTRYGWLYAALGAKTTRVLHDPVFHCGYQHMQAIPNALTVWQRYLDALCDAAGTRHVSVEDSKRWNFAALAARAAKVAA